MIYASTRALHRARKPDEECVFSEAIELGLAPDGGLYMPIVDEDFWRRTASVVVPKCRTLAEDFPGVAAEILAPLIEEGPSGDPAFAAGLPEICRSALNFPVPLRFVGEEVALLELFHGPTAAFKDVGASFLAEFLQGRDSAGRMPRKRTVVVATSGDTGGAVAAAFQGRPNVEVRILFPKGRVSARQQAQLCCWGENIRAIAVRGSFDDCQRMVKEALANPELCSRFGLFAANSINIGRLLPQITYFAFASLAFQRQRGGDPPGIIVPSGNMGNGVAAVLAMRMGFPIREVVFATNANRAVVDFLESGSAAPRPTIPTLANAMDVGIPSNLERLRMIYPGHEDLVRKVSALSVSDEEIREEIVRCDRQWSVAICPHTATAASAWRRLEKAGSWILAATAHPSKFESIVEPLIGHALELPPGLEQLLARKQNHAEVDPGPPSRWL